MDKTTKLIKKTSPTATLRAMVRGSSITISTRDAKTVSVRSAGERLKKYGYLFHVTEQGMINETLVTCLKSPNNKIK